MKKTILISFIILNLFFSGFCIAQETPVDFEAPETFKEAREMGENILDVGKKELPSIIKELWYDNVLPIWQKIYDWFYANIWLKLKSFFSMEVGSRIEQEIETREEIFEEEFKQEKKEVKKELPGLFNYIRKFIRDIVKKIKILWK